MPSCAIMCHHNGMVVSGQAGPACVIRSWLIVQRKGFVSRIWLEGVLPHFQQAGIDSSSCPGIAGMLSLPLHVLQVYGDAVMDEAPLLILTNYHVTVFLKRSDNVQDKRLWASEPIWFDQKDPPARASWVHGLQQAGELRNLKRRLPRAIVPPTVEGYHLQMRRQEAHRQRQQAAAEQQAAEAGSAACRKRQRAAEQQADEPGSSARPVQQRIAKQQADEPSSSARPVRQRTTHVSLRLQARSPSGKGFEVDSHSSLAPQPAAANLTHPGAEKTLTLFELGLTAELLGAGQYGYTLKVSLSAPHTIAPVAEGPALGTLSLFLSTPCLGTCFLPALITDLILQPVWLGCLFGRSPICVVKLLSTPTSMLHGVAAAHS